MPARRPNRKSLPPASVDIVCFCHLRWDFVYQRPQHLMSRFAKSGRVFYIEEPVISEGAARFETTARDGGVTVVVPHVPREKTANMAGVLRALIDRMFREHRIGAHYLWIYTPMAVEWTRHLRPSAVIYDCMDELSAFKGAPPGLKQNEKELLAWADIVFTGGRSLFEAKRNQHPSVYCFPSSVDVAHFASARSVRTEPDDQARIPGPRLGYFGVIDERMDLELLAKVADARPDWHFVIVGPVVKIDPVDLPQRANIHFLGMKKYEQLPSYIAGWDVAILPFARNEATRFISPTKTPEYLAAGRPVVSTSIRDVVNPYGDLGLAHIADEAPAFAAAVEAALAEDPQKRLKEVDAVLSVNSWARTWGRMAELIDDVSSRKTAWPVPRHAYARAASAAGASSGS